MARGLRPRLLTATVLAGLAGSACDSEDATATTKTPPAPPPVDLAAIPDGELPARILEHVFGPVQGNLANSRLRLTDDEDTTWGVSLSLPDALRADLPSGGYLVVRADDAFRTLPGEEGLAAEPLAAGEAARMRNLRDLLAAMVLMPLEGAEVVARPTPRRCRLRHGGEEWELTLRPHSLLPARLEGPPGTVVFEQWLQTHTGVTRMPEIVVLGDLGRRRVLVEGGDIRFEDTYFRRPQESATDDGGATRRVGGESRPRAPEPREEPVRRWLVTADPGGWEERHDTWWQGGNALVAARRTLDGFTTFWEGDDGPVMAIPHREKNGVEPRPLEIPEGWSERTTDPGPVLLVYPEPGSLDDVVDRGRALLRGAAERGGREATGPLRWAPYWHLHEGAPGPEDLAGIEVRMELPVR